MKIVSSRKLFVRQFPRKNSTQLHVCQRPVSFFFFFFLLSFTSLESLVGIVNLSIRHEKINSNLFPLYPRDYCIVLKKKILNVPYLVNKNSLIFYQYTIQPQFKNNSEDKWKIDRHKIQLFTNSCTKIVYGY